MKTTILIPVILFLSLCAQAQITFNEAIGGPLTDEAISAEATSDGGYVVVGWTKSFGAGDWDIYLVKTSATGAIQWTRTYGGPGEEVDCYVHQTFDGGYIITARSTSYGSASSEVYLIKTNVSGDLDWTKTVGGANWDEGHSMIQTPDSGYVHTGFTTSYGAGNNDFYLVRSDKNGITQWTKSFGGSGIDNGHLIISAVDGGYIVLGETTSFGAGGYDFYLVKMDSLGYLQWSRTYGGSGDDHGWDIKATNDSCYIMVGYTNSFGSGNNDAYFIKVDRNGSLLWSKAYGDITDDRVLAVRQTLDGGFIATGETEFPGSGNADVFLLKTDASGTPIWTRTFGGNGDDGSQSVQQTSDGGYFISGYTSSFGQGDWDFYLIKTDSTGQTSGCNLASPTVHVTNLNNLTLTNDPLTLTSSGGMTGSPNSTSGSGGIGMYCAMINGIASYEENSDLVIYPNPATDILEVQYPKELLSFEIFDQLGQRLISHQFLHDNKSIDISMLRKGLYQIRITSKQNVHVQKFVKVD